MSRRVFALVILIVMGLLLSSGMTQAQEFGTNWTAAFFNNPDVAGTPTTTITGVAGVNFNWGSGQPVVNGQTINVGPETFSVRFTSTQTFQQGNYQFTVTADDGVRVFIDGQQVLNRFEGSQAAITNTFTFNMVAGSHTLTIDYFDGVGNALIQVQWGLVGAGGTAVGSATFGPSPTPGPTNTPAPTPLPVIPQGALTATVIRASVLNVRAAPSVYSERVGRIRRGQTYAIVGRDDRARWFLLQLSDRQAWAFGYYLFINGNEFNAPVVSTFVLFDNPAAISGVVARSFSGLRLRAEPSVNSPQIGRIGWGDAMGVVGRTRNGEWLQVVWLGTTGWVYESFTRIVEGDINSVPITG